MLKRILAAVWAHLQGWWRWWAIGVAVLVAYLVGRRRTPPSPPVGPDPLRPIEDDSKRREGVLEASKELQEAALERKKAQEEEDLQRSLRDTPVGPEDTEEVNDFLKDVSKTLPH